MRATPPTAAPLADEFHRGLGVVWAVVGSMTPMAVTMLVALLAALMMTTVVVGARGWSAIVGAVAANDVTGRIICAILGAGGTDAAER